MIVNLNGTANEDTIVFDPPLPAIYFVDNHRVKINEIFIKWKTKALVGTNGYIRSTLIEKSVVNPEQQLLFFCQADKSNYTFVQPTHNAWYKIQNLCLHSSEFNVITTGKQQIEKIYLQLEIINERLQSLNRE